MGSAEPGSPGGGPGSVALLYAGVLVLYVNIYAVPPLTISIIRDLGIGHFQAGLLMTTFSVAYCLGNAGVGYLSDRVGALRVMAGGLAMGFLATLVMSLSGSFAVMVGTRLLSGLAAAAMTAPCLVTLMRWFAPSRRSLSVSLHLASLTLGSALTFLLTPLLLPWLSWRVVLRFYALAGAVLLVAFLPLLRRSGGVSPPAGPRVRGALSGPNAGLVALLCAVLFITMFQIGGTLTWLPPWLQEGGGFSPLQIGLAGMTFSLVGIPSTLLGGVLADRARGRRRERVIGMSMVGLVVSSSLLALVWLQQARLFGVVMLVVVAARWGSFMSVGPLLSLAAGLARGGAQGSLLGVVNAIAMSGSVVAAFAGGLLIQTTGGYATLWVALAAALLFSAIVLHPLLRRAWRAAPAAGGARPAGGGGSGD